MTPRKPEYLHLTVTEARALAQRQRFAAQPMSAETAAKIGAAVTGERSGRYRHGAASARTPEYNSWNSMLQRCNNPKNPAYPNYGGRGIEVCERWHDFANFLADMGRRPEGLTLERVDNDGPYDPSNCRWASRLEQQQNRRSRRAASEDTKAKLRAAWERRKARNAPD